MNLGKNNIDDTMETCAGLVCMLIFICAVLILVKFTINIILM
jgi:hypothetical protein